MHSLFHIFSPNGQSRVLLSATGASWGSHGATSCPGPCSDPYIYPFHYREMVKNCSSEARLSGRVTACKWCCSGNVKARMGGVHITHNTVPGSAQGVGLCTKLPQRLPVLYKCSASPAEIFRNSTCPEVGSLWARLCLTCFLVYEETQVCCMQFLLPLRGKYQTEWPFRWQETQDVGQHMVKYLFL